MSIFLKHHFKAVTAVGCVRGDFRGKTIGLVASRNAPSVDEGWQRMGSRSAADERSAADGLTEKPGFWWDPIVNLIFPKRNPVSGFWKYLIAPD